MGSGRDRAASLYRCTNKPYPAWHRHHADQRASTRDDRDDSVDMAAISNDRFILGLGTSGPQVVEGLQGQPFKAPLARLKETVEIVKLAFAGEKIEFHGKYHELPLPNGQGKALRLSQPGNSNIPIYLATLKPQRWSMPLPWRMVGWARRLPLNTPQPTLTICAGAPKRPGAASLTSTLR
jgi:Luciferase-like monooxygenase